jgi:alkanesulfonate monooxygenase SsuD/methylene tetrahydromethanopterin reductase-like flavin-dependent oxidoreductase (luciferase family)
MTLRRSFPDPQTGETISTADRLRNLVEQVELADQVGLEVFGLGLGEHHRPDFPASAPAVILGAIAARTQKIRLTSAVTVLSSDDPVRVFQDFATLDLLSGGRAEDHGRPLFLHRVISVVRLRHSRDRQEVTFLWEAPNR